MQTHKFRKQNSGYQGWRRERNEESLFNGYRVSVWDDEKVLDMDSENSGRRLIMYLMPLICTFENGLNAE